jgi:hypothetical protein
MSARRTCFAAELLMPAKFLREDVEGVELDLLGDGYFPFFAFRLRANRSLLGARH